jgi:PAS domain S-box-containing protein
MRWSPFASIRTHLLLLVLISLLPALGIVVYSGLDRRYRDIEEAKANALRVAQSLAYDHERTVEGTRLLLMTLAKLPDVQNRSVQACNRLFAQLLRENPLYANIFAATAEGMIFSSAITVKPYTIKERKYFQDILRTKRFSAGEYIMGPASGRQVLPLAQPLVDSNGRIKAVVIAGLDLGRYGQIFPMAKLPEGSTFALLDHKNIYLYHYPDPDKFVGKLDSSQMITHMSALPEEGVFGATGEDGTKRLFAYKRFYLKGDGSPYLYMRVGIPDEKALSHARKATIVNGVLLCLAFLVAIALAWFIGKVIIVRRFDALVAASQHLGHGDLSTRTGLEHKSDELGQLAKAFDEMTEKLERKAVQGEITREALRQSEEKYRNIFNNAIMGTFQTTPDGRYLSVNPALARMYGYDSPEEMIDSIIDIGQQQYVNPADRTRLTALYREAGFVEGFETQAYRRDGGMVWISVNARAVRSERGEILYYEGTVEDITQRKLAEEALRESEERHRVVIEQTGQLVYDLDIPTGNMKRSGAITEITGYDPYELQEGLDSWKSRIHPEDREEVTHILETALEKGVNYHVEYRVQRKDEKYVSIEDQGAVIKNKEGNVHRVLGTMKDITEHKRLEAQLFQSQKMEAVGALAGGIAHDFNNILMGIQGYVSLILLGIDSTHPHYERLKRIEEQVVGAAGLTRQLLGFARGGKYEAKPTDLNEILARSSDMFARTKREITVYRKYGKDLWTVEVDRGQIEQAFLNLYVNAWQAMAEGGELYLEARNAFLEEDDNRPYTIKPGRYVRICVTDTGEGMDETTQKRIFEPFFTTKAMGRGTGLGLASVYGIIKNHGGIINVYSEVNKGTTFNIYLPASQKEPVLEKVPSAETLQGTETILLVDDQDIIIDVGKGLLEALGYKVLAAPGGKEAIDAYRNNKDRIDLVILDMVMPAMNGGETYDALKALNPEVRVILSSGYSMNGQAMQIMDRGCNGFIQKPFNVDELSRKVREVLDK